MIPSLAILIAMTLAQPPARFERVPFEQNLLQEQLRRIRLQNLLQQIKQDPQKFALPHEQLKGLQNFDQTNPEHLKRIQDLVDSHPALKELASKVAGEMGGNLPTPQNPSSPPVRSEFSERIMRWLQDSMKEAEGTNWGDQLIKSQAWKELAKDVEQWLRNPNSGGNDNWKVVDWVSKIQWPEKLNVNFDWVQERLSGLQNINLPNIPRVRFRLPNVNLRFSMPGMPNLSADGFLSSLPILMFVAVLCVLAVVTVTRVRRNPEAPGRIDRGWPLDPGSISTRADLVKAVDYWTLHSFGESAQTWNHLQIAKALPKSQALVALYEEARYAPGADVYSDSDAQKARLALAEVIHGAV